MSWTGLKIGKIILTERLGSGGMGTVYKGIDQELERAVAVKLIHEDQQFTDAMQSRFVREAKTLSKLEHPNICRIYDIIHENESDFIVLEYVKGETLSRCEIDALSHARRLALAIDMIHAVAYAHDHSVIHRDIKPANIMVTDSGSAKVLDFGLAKVVVDPYAVTTTNFPGSSDALPSGVFRTKHGLVMGTPMYMSPEQAKGEPVGTASDIYSLGLLFQWLFTGKHAHDPNLSYDQLLWRAMNAERNPVERAAPEVASLIADMTALEPGLRPRAREVLRRLQWLERAPQRRRRKRLLAATLLSLSIGIIAFAVGYLRTKQANRLALEAKQVALDERDKAQQLAQFFNLFLTSVDVGEWGTDATMAEAIEGSDALLDELGGDPGVQASILMTFAESCRNLGLNYLAYEYGERAFAAYRSTGDEMGCLMSNKLCGEVMINLGDQYGIVLHYESYCKAPPDHWIKARAAEQLSFAINALSSKKEDRNLALQWAELARTIADQTTFVPSDVRWAIDYRYAVSLRALGQLEEAKRELMRLHAQTDAAADIVARINVANSLGKVLHSQGKYQEAVPYLSECFQQRLRHLGVRNPYVEWGLKDLIRTLEKLGRIDEIREVQTKFDEAQGSLFESEPNQPVELFEKSGIQAVIEDLAQEIPRPPSYRVMDIYHQLISLVDDRGEYDSLAVLLEAISNHYRESWMVQVDCASWAGLSLGSDIECRYVMAAYKLFPDSRMLQDWREICTGDQGDFVLPSPEDSCESTTW